MYSARAFSLLKVTLHEVSCLSAETSVEEVQNVSEYPVILVVCVAAR